MTTPTLIRCQTCGKMTEDRGGNSHYEGTTWLHYLEPAEGGDPTAGRSTLHGRERPDATPGAGATKHAPVPERSEKEIRYAIVKTLRALGYGVWDTEQGYRKDGSTRVTKGLPDLFIAGPAGSICVEVKSARGTQTPEQCEFERLWSRHGGTYLVWRSESDALAWHERRASA